MIVQWYKKLDVFGISTFFYTYVKCIVIPKITMKILLNTYLKYLQN